MSAVPQDLVTAEIGLGKLMALTPRLTATSAYLRPLPTLLLPPPQLGGCWSVGSHRTLLQGGKVQPEVWDKAGACSGVLDLQAGKGHQVFRVLGILGCCRRGENGVGGHRAGSSLGLRGEKGKLGLVLWEKFLASRWWSAGLVVEGLGAQGGFLREIR